MTNPYTPWQSGPKQFAWGYAVPGSEPGSFQTDICYKFWVCSYRHKPPVTSAAAPFADTQRGDLSRWQSRVTESKEMRFDLLSTPEKPNPFLLLKQWDSKLSQGQRRDLEQERHDLFRYFSQATSTRLKHTIPQKPWRALTYDGRTIPMRRS